MKVRWALVVLCGVQFIDVLGVTSAITAIPRIIRDLEAPADTAGLLATVYAAFFGGLLVLGSRLGDRYGPRRVLLVGIAAFTAVAIVAVSAQQVVQLLVAIGIQGAAAALGVPCALRLLLHVAAEPQARQAGLAAWGATGAVAGVLGYIVGGVLTEAFGWRAVYAVNAPIGIVLLVAVLGVVPSLPASEPGRRLDLLGAVLLVAAVMGLIVGAALLQRPNGLTAAVGTMTAAILLTVALICQQGHARTPLIPHTAVLAANLRTGSVLSFVNTATTSSAGVLATLLLQQHLRFSPLEAALTLMPFSLGVIGGSVLSRPLATHLPDHRLSGVGLGGVAAGDTVLALTAGNVAGIIVGVVIAGVGLGIAAVAATSLGTRVPVDLTGSATGLLNTAGQLGTALGVAALVSVASITDQPTGTSIAWAVGAVMAAAASVSMLSPGSGRRRQCSAPAR